jgi:hypothetical protein
MEVLNEPSGCTVTVAMGFPLTVPEPLLRDTSVAFGNLVPVTLIICPNGFRPEDGKALIVGAWVAEAVLAPTRLVPSAGTRIKRADASVRFTPGP